MMERSKVGEVSQASRGITAARRQAIAWEMARITGRRARQPSALDQAAVAWEREREARDREAEEERLRIYRPVETLPFSLQQVSLQADGIEPPQPEVDWKSLKPEKGEGIAKVITRRLNMAEVGVLSRRLMAIERAKGRKPWTLGLRPRTRRAQAAHEERAIR